MPAKGKTLKLGKRKNPIAPCFYRTLKNRNKELTDIPNMEIKKIIDRCNELILESIIYDPTGFRLPLMLGHISVNKFKSQNQAVDVLNSRIYKKRIPHLNLHSFGYRFSIMHFKRTESRMNPLTKIFKYVPTRQLTKKLSDYIKQTGGEHFSNYRSNHFISKKKINKLSNVNYSQWD